MIKGLVQEEEITSVNIYALNTGAPKYIKQILTDIKREIYSNTVIIGVFNTHLQQGTDYPDRKLKVTLALKAKLDHMA